MALVAYGLAWAITITMARFSSIAKSTHTYGQFREKKEFSGEIFLLSMRITPASRGVSIFREKGRFSEMVYSLVASE